MDNYRLILVFTLVFLGLLLWQAWQRDYGPQSQPATTEIAQQEASVPGQLPPDEAVPTVRGTASLDASLPPLPGEELVAAQRIRIETDLHRMEIDTRGGTVASLYLNDYPVRVTEPDNKFRLMSPTRPNLFVAQSGLLSAAAAPTHETIYHAPQSEYRMEPGQEQLSVEMVWEEAGMRVTKRFLFTRGEYLIQVQHTVENLGDQPWAGREYRQLIRTDLDSSMQSAFIYTYTGGVYYSAEEKYTKYSFRDMRDRDLERDVQGGWIAMLQHYFLGAWVPPEGQTNRFYSKILSDERYLIGAYTPLVELEPGASHTFESGFLAGPKLQEYLKQVAPGLHLAVDYGMLTILAQPIFWLLSWIYGLVGNWGWSIILLTILIKAAFYKLSETSYKSMAGLRKLAPRIQALKDRYGEDKQRMNQAMMEIYKTEKINPLGGCLPILVQIPVFIALYWVLLESVEMRQAPFILWIQDLSIRDPYFILPLIMGVSMYVQQKLNPAPPDPMQAKILMALPFVFTFFFAFFPAGLVLYWVVNNLLSIAQQWYITRKVEAGEKV